MKYLITICLLLSAMFCNAQRDGWDGPSLSTKVDSIGQRLYLWIDKVDHMYVWQATDRQLLWKLLDTIDSLTHELKNQKALLQFNTDMGNIYIRKVDSLRQHGIGVYPQWQKRDTLAMGPFYLY